MKRNAALGLALTVALSGCTATGGASKGSTTTSSASNLKPTTPPLPAGWKPVTAYAVTVDVPSSWPVQKWQPTCGVQTPTVYTGPQGLQPHCSSIAPAAEVDIGAFPHPIGRVKRITNGLVTYVFMDTIPYPGPPSATLTEAWVQITGKVTLGLYFRIPDTAALPGGGPDMLQRLIATVHVAS